MMADTSDVPTREPYPHPSTMDQRVAQPRRRDASRTALQGQPVQSLIDNSLHILTRLDKIAANLNDILVSFVGPELGETKNFPDTPMPTGVLHVLHTYQNQAHHHLDEIEELVTRLQSL